MQIISPIGITNFRSNKTAFGIKDQDRLNHIYVLGKTGTGKSTLLLNMAIADIHRGNGLCVIDPHGDLADTLLDYIPEERISDVIYFNPADESHIIGFNPLYSIHDKQKQLLISGILATFKKIWSDTWGPRLEYILRYALITLCNFEYATLLDIQPLLTNYDFRQRVLAQCTDEHIRSFWYHEFDKYPPPLKAEAISPILNKVGSFTTTTLLRNIIGQATNGFDIDEVLNKGKILICNLSKGKLGEDTTTLLGSMLINALQLAAVRRATITEADRKPFYLYVDEMHSFISLSFSDILAEARKYKLSLFLAHQYLDQVHEKIQAAIFGNVGTMILFRVGAADAKTIVNEFHPPFTEEDIINLPKYAMYIKLMIDGTTSKPFSAETLPLPDQKYFLKDTIIAMSHMQYGKSISVIEKEIHNRGAIGMNATLNQTLF